MTDLDALIPPHEPAEDALAFAGKAALAIVPIVGSLAADTLAHALESRQAQRQHEFNVAIAEALSTALEKRDDATPIEDVLGSDEFIAGVTRAQRAAAETASQQKRRRLAAAVVNGGSWAPFAATEREQFTRLVDEFDALHVWMLHYFMDPRAWLEARDLYRQHKNIRTGGVDGPFGTALDAHPNVWRGAVTQAAADLDRNGLASIPLTTMMSASGIFDSRTSAKGQRFLAFINELDSVAADVPEQL